MPGLRRSFATILVFAVVGAVSTESVAQARVPKLTAAQAREPSSAQLAAADLALERELLGEHSAEQAAAVAAARAAAEKRQEARAALTAVLAGYDHTGSVDLSVAVVDRLTGQTFSYAGGRSYETASIVKVAILASLLLQKQRSGRKLSSSDKSLAEEMIEDSDNDAASDLWERAGGISTAIKAFGLSSTRADADGDWGLTTTTALDQVQLVDGLADPDGPLADPGYLFDLMGDVDDDQDWGISAAAQPGEDVVLKNGWLPRTNQNGRWIVNSVGRITDADTDLSIAVLSGGQPSYGAGIAMVENAAMAVRTYLGW